MKNIKEILTHIKYSPEFKKINTQSALNKLIELLPFNIKKGVLFAYTKNQTLFFVVSHPVYKMEFKYSENLIKDLLKKLHLANIEEVKCFVTNKKVDDKNFEYEKVVIEKIKEKSNGIFDNNIEDKNLYNIFEEIRNIVKSD